MNTRETILQIIQEKWKISNSEIVKIIHISNVAIYKHLKVLLKEGKMQKHGKARLTQYPPIQNTHYEKIFQKISENLSEIYENAHNINIPELIDSLFISFLPNGKWLQGMESLIYCIQRENNNIYPNTEKKYSIFRYHQRKFPYTNYRNSYF